MVRNFLVSAALAATLAASAAMAAPGVSNVTIADMMKNSVKHAYGEPGVVPEGWVWVPVPEAICMTGEQSGYYYREGLSTHLVVYLMAGGACFNGLCDTLATSDPLGTYPPSNEGIFSKLNNEINPLSDYSWIFIPYCSGDVFLGDADTGNTKIAGEPRQFRGRNMLDVVMKTAYANSPFLNKNLDGFLLTGESAGGFGAVGNWDHFRKTFVRNSDDTAAEYWTSADNVMISDSGIPFGDEWLKPCLQDKWRTLWGADSQLEFCQNCTNQPGNGGLGNIWEYLTTTYKDDRFGLVSTNEDDIISLFYAFGRGLLGCGGELPALTGNKAEFKKGLANNFLTTMGYQNFCHYYFPGGDHTHTTQDRFFREMYMFDEIHGGGPKFLHEWYTDIINNVNMTTCSVENGLLN